MPSALDVFALHLKRADGDFYRKVRSVYQWCSLANPSVPQVLRPIGRFIFDLRTILIMGWKRSKSFFYLCPIFSCRCESVGRGLQMMAMPTVCGHTRIILGDEVQLWGNLGISSGRFYDDPLLKIGSRVGIGHQVSISCNREVVIEDDVGISDGCTISDSDGHPTLMSSRLDRTHAGPGEVKPVHISRGAWICKGSFILKGVTIGEGSVVGANSVVTHDVPPHTIVAGVPAKIVASTSKSWEQLSGVIAIQGVAQAKLSHFAGA